MGPCRPWTRSKIKLIWPTDQIFVGPNLRFVGSGLGPTNTSFASKTGLNRIPRNRKDGRKFMNTIVHAARCGCSFEFCSSTFGPTLGCQRPWIPLTGRSCSVFMSCVTCVRSCARVLPGWFLASDPGPCPPAPLLSVQVEEWFVFDNLCLGATTPGVQSQRAGTPATSRFERAGAVLAAV